jgi:hypothetical protein
MLTRSACVCSLLIPPPLTPLSFIPVRSQLSLRRPHDDTPTGARQNLGRQLLLFLKLMARCFFILAIPHLHDPAEPQQ